MTSQVPTPLLPRRFAGKVCAVTGAGSGIGRATALAFASEGGQVVVADVDEAGGQETVKQIEAGGGEAVFIRTDIASRADVKAMVALAVSQFGRLDCAVNNAGITGGVNAPTGDYPEEAWTKVLAVNLTGTWYCVQEELAAMLPQGSGTIVNVASAAGLHGHPNNVSYAASKHGVVGLTKTAALEYATRGIRVNALCPTGIETPMIMDGRLNLRNNPEALAKFSGQAALKRLGRPEEVADVALWLCSEQSSFITGHALAVDGGAFA
ncbi:SDR family NAD(P)-dependent oxidoreductase [Hymenobacter caeli]|uniref:NAD(P)-dependent dehydrogenase (Short-subunit alcohol dehydrogenase family) n=1 Tax=Hymenobacter caeli TaxID=2735894 RepID=A0ABX2FUM2_9BACT|nr:glucose 1-dehydrogenase [Hymenobacter caeli]NRT20819.1 NAD(P)-dependent dehydrogenase (short-subunit alcohol dehydrogenase family) [Hymenobacter caeli]